MEAVRKPRLIGQTGETDNSVSGPSGNRSFTIRAQAYHVPFGTVVLPETVAPATSLERQPNGRSSFGMSDGLLCIVYSSR
jgi:hypothetical protein